MFQTRMRTLRKRLLSRRLRTGMMPKSTDTGRPLERTRSLDQQYSRDQQRRRRDSDVQAEKQPPGKQHRETYEVSRLATQLYTISYLILFSIFGTLARLGLQALTYYPGAPMATSVVWPNFAGCIVMGFLSEDRKLFLNEWGTPNYHQQIQQAKKTRENEESGSSSPGSGQVDLAAAKKAHMATKKTIPLYIGLATGFCGSFTSFSSFIRDVFLALSNDLTTPDGGSTPMSRNGGYSFMALLAVILTTVSLSISGLFVGAHLAICLEPVMPSLPFFATRKVVDRISAFLAWGCWLGAVLLSIFPPDRSSHPGASETWRGRATFALVFAPLGCLGRFYASLYLNGRIASFPLGTFVVNIFGTAVLGMAWDLAHVPSGGVIGCQVLQGIEDGFCGCLTTVSTWASELTGLRRRHAYIYGFTSVIVALAFLVAIMGGLRWSHGFESLKCLH
ncbi:CrcB-like protein [Apiospora phragmitis]|uniref:CrcB-like protein n=1 Tax=Apiospora phragmitis TaxID=2905665 RepID=A0ABR1W2F1_9PEZI